MEKMANLDTGVLGFVGSDQVLISRYNRLPDGRYFDTESETSFEFDHITQVSNSIFGVALENAGTMDRS